DGPTAEHQKDLLAFHQTFRHAVCAVLEGESPTHDVIDPGLEYRGNVEVVHRSFDEEDIASHDLSDELTRKREAGRIGTCISGVDEIGTDMRQGAFDQIAGDYSGAGMSLPETGQCRCADLAGYGGLQIAAGRDVKNCGHSSRSHASW